MPIMHKGSPEGAAPDPESFLRILIIGASASSAQSFLDDVRRRHINVVVFLATTAGCSSRVIDQTFLLSHATAQWGSRALQRMDEVAQFGNIFQVTGELLSEAAMVDVDLGELGKFVSTGGQLIYCPYNKLKPAPPQGK